MVTADVWRLDVADTRARGYVAYLLRLWLAGAPGEPVWRGLLEDPHTGSRLGFADLASLFEYLRRQTESRAGVPGDQEEQN